MYVLKSNDYFITEDNQYSMMSQTAILYIL